MEPRSHLELLSYLHLCSQRSIVMGLVILDHLIAPWSNLPRLTYSINRTRWYSPSGGQDAGLQGKRKIQLPGDRSTISSIKHRLFSWMENKEPGLEHDAALNLLEVCERCLNVKGQPCLFTATLR
ncbi:hypothetical protein BDV37DRAFT_31195 [Aspergillus pseudonomiae]|uniref:Uncharacterized protein n=1 Tax=Aspergillus pseudonomiae TaxID=1506151 RepID=A0A5N7DLK8_9EURO|nr:uncharacterized protein BDV37DRAFT_31195 [Aspergillus pseudonomiae]KAE8407326.1 hypothetical protein BDV37DRAFT_31195 [Aspergillus pseudonomiae]